MSGLIAAGSNDARELVGEARRLVLIEPQAAVFKRLQANFADVPNVTLVRTALGSKRGAAEMRVSDYDVSSSLLDPALHLDLYVARFDGREMVPVDTLDSVMAAIPDACEFTEMILDVQGYELEVLRGASVTLWGLDRIECEVNAAEMFRGCPLVADIDAYLEAFGFARSSLNLYGLRGAWGDAVYERVQRASDADLHQLSGPRHTPAGARGVAGESWTRKDRADR